MSKSIQKSSGIGKWWDNRPTWQKWGIGIGGTALVVAGAYAIAAYGATATITTSAGRISVAIGKAALENKGMT